MPRQTASVPGAPLPRHLNLIARCSPATPDCTADSADPQDNPRQLPSSSRRRAHEACDDIVGAGSAHQRSRMHQSVPWQCRAAPGADFLQATRTDWGPAAKMDRGSAGISPARARAIWTQDRLLQRKHRLLSSPNHSRAGVSKLPHQTPQHSIEYASSVHRWPGA